MSAKKMEALKRIRELLQWLSSRMNTAEQRINHLEDRSIESFESKKKKKKKHEIQSQESKSCRIT